MDRDDPFATVTDSDRTVIRPRPGGRMPAATPGPRAEAPAAAAPRPPAARSDLPGGRLDLTFAAANPLVRAAGPLLALTSRLRSTPAVPDLEALRERTIREFRDFETRAMGEGVTPEELREGRYALAATIDDIAQNTPWGGHGAWARKSMVNVFNRETFGGERFFELLDHVRRDPARNLNLLELMYLCLALGFEGRYRLAARGASELNRIRDDVYRAIRNQRGEFERELSPHWRGVAAAHTPLRRYLPVWMLGLICAGLLFLIFSVFLFLLINAREPALAALGKIPPAAAEIVRPPAPRPVAPAPPPENAALERLRAFLAPEIAQRLVEVLPDGHATKIRILDSGMFASGSAEVQPKSRGLLMRIGDALREEPGRILVTGHTDNVPIRRSLRFPSNLELSLARAEAVQAAIGARLGDPSRMTAEGRADTEPLVPNDTAENRARNRRVDIELFR